MILQVIGRKAIDEPCCCRGCGHMFTTSQALTKLDGTGIDPNKLLICCPSCRSDDVIPRDDRSAA